MAISETRPPITAGPIDRAFRFLKRTSVNCGAPELGAGVIEADNGGVVPTGEAARDAPAAAGDAGGDSSWAKEIEQTRKALTKASRLLIGVET